MKAHQVVTGFSDIKSELRTKAGITKSLNDMQLWFSFEEDVLYVHDYEDHIKSLALAIFDKNQNTWLVTFRGHYYGRKVIEYGIRTCEGKGIEEHMHDLYRLHGFVGFSGG